MSIRTKMSELLKENKKLHEVTYDQIAKDTKISKTSIRYAMNGGKEVGINVFEKLFDYFNLDLEIIGVEKE